MPVDRAVAGPPAAVESAVGTAEQSATATASTFDTASRHELAWALSTGLAVVALLAARAPETWSTIWAEDGKVFMGDALHNGVRSFGHFYEGYLHLVPRLGGALAAALPLVHADVAIAAVAATVTGASAAIVEYASGSHLRHRASRVAVGLSVGFLPALRIESIMNMANLQFTLLYATFWVLISSPTRRGARVVGIVTVAATSMSTLLAAAYVPLAAVRLRDKRARSIAATMIAFTALHWLLVEIAQPDRTLIEHVTFTSIVRGFKVDVLAGQLFGGTIGELDVSVTLVVGAVLVLVLAATMLLHDLPRHATGRPLLFVLAIAYSTAFYVGEAHVGGVHARYAVLPGLLLLAALAVGVDAALSSHPLRYAFVPALAALAVGLACARGFSAGSFRTDGPTWSTSVDAARSTCAATRQRTIVVAILPANGEWSVTVPCERLR